MLAVLVGFVSKTALQLILTITVTFDLLTLKYNDRAPFSKNLRSSEELICN